MAKTVDLSPLSNVIEAIAGRASRGELVLEAGVGVAGFVLAWVFARAARRKLRENRKWKFGQGDFERAAFPVLALVFVSIGKAILASRQDTHLLEIAVTLLCAYAAIRVAAYVLGHVIPEGGSQRIVIRIVAWTAWIVAILYVTGLLPNVVDILEAHGFRFGKNKTEITLLDLLKGAAALFLTIAFALYLSRVTEDRVFAADHLDNTTKAVIAKVIRITMLFIAIFIALPMAGIDVTTLSIFGGALGVGLGFGLQKIASNYVSGFIVLLERSLRIGDVITVDNKRGEVQAIESRYTVIKGSDGVETILPNEKLITETVQHHTYSDPKVSVVISVFVSYESEVDRACDLLVEIARGHKRVIPDPAPIARVKQLGDNGIELELTVWIADPAVGEADLKSVIFKDLLRRFREGGIEIPYPRRDVHLLNTLETWNSPITSRS